MARRSRLLRVLDTYAGIPAVLLLSARRLRTRRRAGSPRSVAFLTTAAIGDTVLISAIVQDARVTWPQARIFFFAGGDNAGAARLIPGVDEVRVLPVTRPWSAVRQLRSHQIDLLVDCGQWPRLNAVLAALSGARHIVGFRTAGQHRHHAFDAAADHSPHVHELENFRGLARAAGIDPRCGPALTGSEIPWDRLPAPPFAVCHMWSAGTRGWQKEWPADRWAALVGWLTRKGLQVLVTGSRADAPRSAAFCARPEVDRRRVSDVAGQFSLAELTGLLSRSAVVVSVNTGVMHLAATVGAPTVALEGPTPALRWGPIGPRARSVSSTLPGCGFLDLGWEYAGQRSDCMHGISVDQVTAAIDVLLSSAHAHRDAG